MYHRSNPGMYILCEFVCDHLNKINNFNASHLHYTNFWNRYMNQCIYNDVQHQSPCLQIVYSLLGIYDFKLLFLANRVWLQEYKSSLCKYRFFIEQQLIQSVTENLINGHHMKSVGSVLYSRVSNINSKHVFTLSYTSCYT